MAPKRETNMDRLKAYTTPAPGGRGITVDTEGMMVDLIAVYKAGGYGLTQMIDHITEIWPDVKVQITIPKSLKN